MAFDEHWTTSANNSWISNGGQDTQQPIKWVKFDGEEGIVPIDNDSPKCVVRTMEKRPERRTLKMERNINLCSIHLR